MDIEADLYPSHLNSPSWVIGSLTTFVGIVPLFQLEAVGSPLLLLTMIRAAALHTFSSMEVMLQAIQHLVHPLCQDHHPSPRGPHHWL